MVPSLTETLIDCGVEVVGRTRFCIHPLDKIRTIPVVGGTKEVNWGRCAKLNPNLVVFDKEEEAMMIHRLGGGIAYSPFRVRALLRVVGAGLWGGRA